MGWATCECSERRLEGGCQCVEHQREAEEQERHPRREGEEEQERRETVGELLPASLGALLRYVAPERDANSPHMPGSAQPRAARAGHDNAGEHVGERVERDDEPEREFGEAEQQSELSS